MEAGNSSLANAQVPAWLKRYLRPQDLDLIEASVREAEIRTQGEIVPVLVRSSVPLNGAYLSCFLFFVAVMAILDLAFLHELGWWSFSLALLVGLGLGWGATRIRAVLELFVPDADEWKAVHERAELEFYRLGMQKTRDRSGILIFVSMFEHKVVVLADEGIAGKLPPQIWQDTVSGLTASLRRRELALGLTQSVKSCADVLHVHFPPDSSLQNELKNHLVIKE